MALVGQPVGRARAPLQRATETALAQAEAALKALAAHDF